MLKKEWYVINEEIFLDSLDIPFPIWRIFETMV